jgi:ribonuclease HII
MPLILSVSNAFQAYIEKEDSKKLKQKQRERMQPKMGKMDIDYQVSQSRLRPM